MGTTNIKLGLERKYVRVKGERMSKEADLIHIRNLIASLPELEARVASLRELEDSMAVVLGHIGLGSLLLVYLAEARKPAYLIRKDIHNGLDPIAERKKAKLVIPTFREATKQVHAERRVA